MVEIKGSSLYDDPEEPDIVVATTLGPPMDDDLSNGTPSVVHQGQWSCAQCTLLNPTSASQCDACLFPNPHAPTGGNLNHAPPFGDSLKKTDLWPWNETTSTAQPESPLIVEEQKSPVGEAESNWQKKMRRRRRRRRRMVAAGVGGAVLGGVTMGPIGAIAVAAGGVYGARVISKRKEALKDASVRAAEQQAVLY